MKNPSRIRSILRVSLRTFLIACVLLSIAMAWIANEYSDFKTEQAMLRNWKASTPRGTLEINTMGKSEFLVGGDFLM